MSPRNPSGKQVRELDPERDGYCHSAPSKRTKCACGLTCELRHVRTVCACGRVHVREPGASAFNQPGTYYNPVRPGGRAGCPGTYWNEPHA